MHHEEYKKALSSHKAPVEKYYGKWPFRRVLGMQELVSVLASLANLLVHAICLRRLRRHVLQPQAGAAGTSTESAAYTSAAATCVPAHITAPQCHDGRGGAAPLADSRRAYPFLPMWTAYSCLHMNAWLWSAVFHCRDTRATERLDYCSAILLVAAGLATSLARMAWGPTRRRRAAALLAVACVAAGAVRHLRYMLLIKFDYGYNMLVCVCAGVASALLWVIWVACTRHAARRTMYGFVAAVHAAMLLEVLDFPPAWGLLDAHAAWHVATVPLTRLFYDWLAADAEVWHTKSKRV